MFSEKLAPLARKTDLVVLPEMFTTGFSMNAQRLAEPMDGPTMVWMRDSARSLDAALAGSFICEEEGKFFNRLIFMRPDGSFDFYDKKHLFSLAGEHEFYEAGNKRRVLEWLGYRICPLICYDLRFPVWSRNTRGSFIAGLTPFYDVLLYVANWPHRRAHHWRSLLTARAIENQAYVVGVNIAGRDGNGFEYVGDSAVIEFSGDTLAQMPDGEEGHRTVEISAEKLQAYRRQLPFLEDADGFSLTT